MGPIVLEWVVARSPETVAFANEILNSQGSVEPTTAPQGISLSEKVRRAELPYQYGIRKTVDDDGFPALIAFGQWASVTGANSSAQLAAQYKAAAINQARLNADRLIAQFLAGQTNAEVLDNLNFSNQDYDEVELDGFMTSHKVSELLERSLQKY